MKALALVASIAVAYGWAIPAAAQTGGAVVATKPGAAVAAQTVKLDATITAIDPATRGVTLKGPKGNEVVIVAGPEVKNFAQMKVGDNVAVEYVEALTLELKKGGGRPVARSDEAAGGSAKPGERPAGVGGRRVTVMADVVDVDTANQRVTLRGPNRTVDLKVRDPKQLEMIKKGDQVEAVYTEAIAVAVSPAAKK
jgi:Cu/Ag efflux protein CusF